MKSVHIDHGYECNILSVTWLSVRMSMLEVVLRMSGKKKKADEARRVYFWDNPITPVTVMLMSDDAMMSKVKLSNRQKRWKEKESTILV